MMTPLEELLNYIFDGNSSPLSREFDRWVRGSRRFKAFAADYSSKIRNKLKNSRDQGGLKDIRAELETAAVLLREERFTLEYEKYAALKQRGPDFTVTYKTHTPFNVEVRRIRSVELEAADDNARTGKLMSVLCDKVGQMPPGIINFLWLTAARDISEADVARATLILQQLADRKDEDFFTRRGFESAAGFYKQYRRLSGIVLPRSGAHVVWLNALAQHKPPAEIVMALQRLASP